MKKFATTLAFLVVSCLLGCGGGNVGMSGTVTFSDNGEPLQLGTVYFSSPSFESRGRLDEKGNYTIGSLKESDGLPKGTYTVYVNGANRFEGSEAEGNFRMVPLIDRKFTQPETSGLTVNVDGKSKRFDFKVDRLQPKDK